MKKHNHNSTINLLTGVTLVLVSAAASWTVQAAGHIDTRTVIRVPHGAFNGIQYIRYEAMFEGVTPNNHPYRVPCQFITPQNPRAGRRTLLFDWLVPSTIGTAVQQEQADARYTLTDAFLFGRGFSYATVRCNPVGIGTRSSVSHPARPWSDDLLDTSSEFIVSPGDEFDIVTDYVKALRTEPIARQLLGIVRRTAAFGYSASGYRLRGLLRTKMGEGLFDFSLVGGTGNGFDHAKGNEIGFSNVEKAPRAGAGLEIDFQSETDVIAFGGHLTRHEEPNYRVYQFAGASHIRNIDVAEFGLPDPEKANPADWVPFFRALLVAGHNWCDGIQPPASLWLGAPNDETIVRDANGNALVRFVGTQPVDTTDFRLPEVAVGENQYLPLDPSYNDGSFLGLLRMIAGGHVDLSANITDPSQYLSEVKSRACALKAGGYLLPADADEIIKLSKQKFPSAD